MKDSTYLPSFSESSDTENDNDTSQQKTSSPKTKKVRLDDKLTVARTTSNSAILPKPITSANPEEIFSFPSTTEGSSSGLHDQKKIESDKIFVKSSNNIKGKRAWDKRYACVYCEKRFPKLPRHFSTMHTDESEVKKLIGLSELQSDSNETKKMKLKMRKEILDDLRRKGNFNSNIKVLKKGEGELVVKRCPPKEEHYSNYLPCQFCLEFFFKKDLFRHMKTCPCKREGIDEKSGGRVQSQAAMLLPQHSEISAPLRSILERMKVDEISTAVKTDDTIIKYGNSLCHKHFNNDDQTYHISNKLRELGRLLVEMRQKQLVKNFKNIINPQLYSEVVRQITILCGWDEERKTIETPSLGIKLGQLLTKMAILLKGEAIMSCNPTQRANSDDFLYLVSQNWNDDISKLSRTELENRKWNKPQLLPLTEDLKTLKLHLSEVMASSISKLAADNANVMAWRNLCSSTLASILIFNRRRQGEAAKLEIKHIKEMKKGTPHDDISESLTSFERQLCEHFKRVEIRGKRGRKVPMLISRKWENSINLLNELRSSVGINPDNKYVFAVQGMESLSYIRGSDAIRKHVKLCSLKCPEAISSTKLRKHIATLSQLVNLEERELEMLAGYLGHDINIHREFYRLPEDTLQVAKCSKILMMMDQGSVNINKGKRLDELQVDLEGNIEIL